MLLAAIVFLSYLVISLFSYFMHWVLHQKWAKRFYMSHMVHHSKMYPATDMLSDEYRSAGKDNTVYFFAVAAIPIIMLPIISFLMGWISLPLMLLALAEMGIFGFLNNYCHDSLHLKNHFIHKFSIGRLWRKLHYFHHLDNKKNLGIFTFWTDKLFKTFKSH